MRVALLALPQMFDPTELTTAQTFALEQVSFTEESEGKGMSSLVYTCSGTTCPAGSLGLGRIPDVGNDQGDEGGKVVTSKAQLLPCSPPDRSSGTAETEGWGTEGVVHREIQEADVPSPPHQNTGSSLLGATREDPF